MKALVTLANILMKLEFYTQVFEKSWNTKFHENPLSESRAVPCGQTGRHEEGNGGSS
jgi:hypothetical protein